MICQAWLVLLGQFCVVPCTDVFYLVNGITLVYIHMYLCIDRMLTLPFMIKLFLWHTALLVTLHLKSNA